MYKNIKIKEPIVKSIRIALSVLRIVVGLQKRRQTNRWLNSILAPTASLAEGNFASRHPLDADEVVIVHDCQQMLPPPRNFCPYDLDCLTLYYSIVLHQHTCPFCTEISNILGCMQLDVPIFINTYVVLLAKILSATTW